MIAQNQPAENRDRWGTDSLLFPPDCSTKLPGISSPLTLSAWHDLGLEQILSTFTENQDHQKEIRGIFSQLIQDPDVIRYRQDILADLLCHPELVDRLTSLLPIIDSLARFSFQVEQGLNSLY